MRSQEQKKQAISEEYTLMKIRQITLYRAKSPRTVPDRLFYRTFEAFEPSAVAA